MRVQPCCGPYKLPGLIELRECPADTESAATGRRRRCTWKQEVGVNAQALRCCWKVSSYTTVSTRCRQGELPWVPV